MALTGEMQGQLTATVKVETWLLAAGVQLPFHRNVRGVDRYRRRKYTTRTYETSRKIKDLQEQLREIHHENRQEDCENKLVSAFWSRLAKKLTQQLLQSSYKETVFDSIPTIALQSKLLPGGSRGQRYGRDSVIGHMRRLSKASRLSIGTSVTPVHLYTEGDSPSESPSETRHRVRNRPLHLSQAYCMLPVLPKTYLGPIVRRKPIIRKVSMQSPLRTQTIKSKSPVRSYYRAVQRRQPLCNV